ncbi:MAG: entericidin [Bacteroidales bacterium]
MKKLFFLLAIAGLASFAACKSGETKSEATADTTQVQAATTDTAVAAPAATDTTVKK